MNGRAEIIEQTSARERIAAGAQSPERHSPVGQAPKRGQQRRRYGVANVYTAADKQNIDRSQVLERSGGGQGKSAARFSGTPVHADDGPFVNLLANQPIRHA